MTASALVDAQVRVHQVVICGTPGDELQIGLRNAEPADEGVVMSAWLRGHRETGDWPRRMPEARYFAEHKGTVVKLLARSVATVACNPERPEQVLGFIVWERPRNLHWLYVKQFVRGNGIARALWDYAGRPTECSHWTLASQRIGGRWWLRYNPFLLGEP